MVIPLSKSCSLLDFLVSVMSITCPYIYIYYILSVLSRVFVEYLFG
ncbi:hypothetical protein CLOBOL_07122 [Enterocloster bolteae ATCC BAA-613]|uniref:Uncharacterized protein n=1 Tax=Enterocloster bolteae (strain ATCC BAA-613 / DSM 15670 / CCUG 46953 / JCM 12243 / WAL 16351) TaxID=411902 RepID=A8S572_ENTBW|nr:hypothetical protein CLOBOL_07122 [Enterocloster bolteae ATCC BAA-613]